MNAFFRWLGFIDHTPCDLRAVDEVVVRMRLESADLVDTLRRRRMLAERELFGGSFKKD